MELTDKDLGLDNIIENTEKSFLKLRENGLLLSDNQIEILNRNEINYKKCLNIKQLIFVIDEVLEESEDEELEELVNQLSEFNYYHYTNK